MAGRRRQGEQVEDDEDNGTRDVFASRAPGTFFFFRFYYFTNDYYTLIVL
jgi:hypothetical protein